MFLEPMNKRSGTGSVRMFKVPRSLSAGHFPTGIFWKLPECSSVLCGAHGCRNAGVQLLAGMGSKGKRHTVDLPAHLLGCSQWMATPMPCQHHAMPRLPGSRLPSE